MSFACQPCAASAWGFVSFPPPPALPGSPLSSPGQSDGNPVADKEGRIFGEGEGEEGGILLGGENILDGEVRAVRLIRVLLDME